MKVLRQFMNTDEINETRDIQDIPPNELCPLLCKFFLGVRKAGGGEYEPSSLRGFLSSFDRYLRRRKYTSSLHSSADFAQVQEVLKSKQKELKRSGHGNKPNKAEAISERDIEMLWEKQQLGSDTPDSIINTLWFYNTVHFGLRGSDEHREMCWDDIKLCADTDGQEYLEFTERQTKTRTGSNPRDVRTVKPKMWANQENTEKCPVRIYKYYSMLRPADYCRPDDPFYIATNTKKIQLPSSGKPPMDIAFKKQPIGVNKLSSLMSRMATKAGLSADKKLSNHSARKHLVQKLSDNNVPPTQIMQITGHKNIQSVNNYSHLNETQHKQISNIISNPNSTQSSSMSLAQHNTAVSNIRSQNVLTSSQNIQDCMDSMFSGNIYGGTFKISIDNSRHSPLHTPAKRRRIIVDDSDSD